MTSAPLSSPPTAPRASSADRRLKWKDRALILLAAAFGALVLRLYRLTLRMEIDEENILRHVRQGEHVIVVFWHGRLLMLPFCYRGRGVRVLISSSRDGELIARVVRRFGLEAVRGSSTRGGSEAMDIMRRALAEGLDVGITPDGPKGPRYRVKPGVVELARESGVPVICVTAASHRGKRLGSWDRFLVPTPFDKVYVRWSESIRIAPDEDFEAARLRIETLMNDERRRLDARAGYTGED